VDIHDVCSTFNRRRRIIRSHDLPDVELGIYMDPPTSDVPMPGPGLEVEVLGGCKL